MGLDGPIFVSPPETSCALMDPFFASPPETSCFLLDPKTSCLLMDPLSHVLRWTHFLFPLIKPHVFWWTLPLLKPHVFWWTQKTHVFWWTHFFSLLLKPHVFWWTQKPHVFWWTLNLMSFDGPSKDMSTKKKVIFLLRQFSIYFCENFMDWVSRIDWCEGHWHGSTYMVVRLSGISPNTA